MVFLLYFVQKIVKKFLWFNRELTHDPAAQDSWLS